MANKTNIYIQPTKLHTRGTDTTHTGKLNENVWSDGFVFKCLSKQINMMCAHYSKKRKLIYKFSKVSIVVPNLTLPFTVRVYNFKYST